MTFKIKRVMTTATSPIKLNPLIPFLLTAALRARMPLSRMVVPLTAADNHHSKSCLKMIKNSPATAQARHGFRYFLFNGR